jgi:hypothetical protein
MSSEINPLLPPPEGFASLKPEGKIAESTVSRKTTELWYFRFPKDVSRRKQMVASSCLRSPVPVVPVRHGSLCPAETFYSSATLISNRSGALAHEAIMIFFCARS